MQKAIQAINETGVGISTLFTIDLPEAEKHDLVLHLDAEDPATAIKAVESAGYQVSERSR